MLLWKWCDLLSRGQREETARHLANHLRVSLQEKKLIFFGPGYLPNLDDGKIDAAQASLILSDHPAAAEFLRRLLPPDLADPPDRSIAEDVDSTIAAEWINDPELSRLLFENLSDEDYWPGVVQRLQELRRANARKFLEYRALAVALALVYDQALPIFWPHRQVDSHKVPIAPMPVTFWFNFWIEGNESQALMFDLRRLSPGEIKYIVDAPLDLSEFRWARKNAKYQRSDLAKAFDAVSYSQERIGSGRFHWEGGDYTLQIIRLQGGICVDQAYYAAIVGKARGFPTLFFTGQGSQGGHAWFGYLKGENQWELDCGRYKYQNYAIGEALDPQTWLPISDHQLNLYAKGLRDPLAYFASEDDILIGHLSESAGDTSKALDAYESAMQVCPQNPSGWAAKADYLVRAKAPANLLRSHHEAAIQQFLTNRDVRVTHQIALAELARQAGDISAAESLERQIIAQNKRQRSDLSVNVAARKVIALVDARQFDQALAEYRRQLKAVGKTGGGHLFYDIVQPLVEALVAAGREAEARECLALARKSLAPVAGGTIDGDLRELEMSLRSSPGQ
jgi:tetratricopeptide (TPR) repeat protein